MVSAVEETGVTLTSTGLFNMPDASPLISGGMVAEKNKVCLFCGNAAITRFTS